MICELIALGCLVAHGDLRAKKTSLLKMYAADVIMRELGDLHKDFYPYPVQMQKMPDGSAHLAEITNPFLSKPDLMSLCGKCGDKLHRGTVKKLMSPTANPPQNFDDIIGWTNKVINLLREHRIALFEPGTHIICSLNPSDTQRVQVAFAATFSPDQKLTEF